MSPAVPPATKYKVTGAVGEALFAAIRTGTTAQALLQRIAEPTTHPPRSPA